MRYRTEEQVLVHQRAERRATVVGTLTLLVTAPPLIALGFGAWWLVGWAIGWTQGEIAWEIGPVWYVAIPVVAGGFPSLNLAAWAHGRYAPPPMD